MSLRYLLPPLTTPGSLLRVTTQAGTSSVVTTAGQLGRSCTCWPSHLAGGWSWLYGHRLRRTERRYPPGATAESSAGSHGCSQGLAEAGGCGRVWPGWWRKLRHEGWMLGRQKRGHGVHRGPLPSFQLSSSLFLKKLMFIGVELLYKVMLLLCCKAKLINSTNTYIPPFFGFPPHLDLRRALSGVP